MYKICNKYAISTKSSRVLKQIWSRFCKITVEWWVLSLVHVLLLLYLLSVYHESTKGTTRERSSQSGPGQSHHLSEHSTTRMLCAYIINRELENEQKYIYVQHNCDAPRNAWEKWDRWCGFVIKMLNANHPLVIRHNNNNNITNAWSVLIVDLPWWGVTAQPHSCC